ncbi:MAG: hypothetical protein ACRCU1_18910, partial [Alsobacter sp.]
AAERQHDGNGSEADTESGRRVQVHAREASIAALTAAEGTSAEMEPGVASAAVASRPVQDVGVTISGSAPRLTSVASCIFTSSYIR